MVLSKKTQESILDKETLAKIKEDLTASREQIIKELKAVSETGEKTDKKKVKFPDYGTKIDENAQEIDEYSTNLVTEKVLENTLRDINSTLDRINKGKYGICKYCGKEIGKKRLLARPVASACVECKTKLQSRS